jgi:uncharacterized protein
VALSFPDVIKSKYLLLTTFTKDGRPKPTPIWGVPDGDKLLVITDDGSWKTKRINNTPRVTIAKSAALGKPKSEEVEAVARVLPKSETRRVYNAVLKRYWYHAWWFYAHSIVRGGIDKVHIGIEVSRHTLGTDPALEEAMRRTEASACHHGVHEHRDCGDADARGARHRDQSAAAA